MADDSDDDAAKSAEPEWGMGVKVRRWKASKRMQRLFVGDSPGPARNDGAGIDMVRRLRDTEVRFGFGYDPLTFRDGYWLEKGGDPLTPGEVDYTTFHDFEWYTLELAGIRLVKLHPMLEARFGIGIGVGWFRGEIREIDAVCTSDRIQQDCMPDPTATEAVKDIPPVFPVINGLVGLAVKPFSFLHLQIEAGLHTTPYVGAGASFFVW